MMFPDYSRKRRYARLKNTFIAGCFKTKPADLDQKERRLADSAQARSGGFVFESSRQFMIGDILRLELQIPGWDNFLSAHPAAVSSEGGNRLTVLAKVVMVEHGAQGMYEIGVCFINLDNGRRELLLRHLIAGMHAALAVTVDPNK